MQAAFVEGDGLVTGDRRNRFGRVVPLVDVLGLGEVTEIFVVGTQGAGCRGCFRFHGFPYPRANADSVAVLTSSSFSSMASPMLSSSLERCCSTFAMRFGFLRISEARFSVRKSSCAS